WLVTHHFLSYIFACYSPIFFFNDTPTTQIYTLSLHDALPISSYKYVLNTVSLRLASSKYQKEAQLRVRNYKEYLKVFNAQELGVDRKSTRLNSSHRTISYAVFCLKKKKKKKNIQKRKKTHKNK